MPKQDKAPPTVYSALVKNGWVILHEQFALIVGAPNISESQIDGVICGFTICQLA
jgi:hypothetical protein